MPKNHVFSLYGEVAFTTSETRGMRHRVGFWKAPKPLTSLVNRVGITAELPDGRHLWCRSYSDGRSDADHSENSPSATTIHSEADCIRKRSGSGRGRLGPKPNSLLRLCCFVCSFDVEAVFIFPWATRLEIYGTFGLVEMAIFIFILVLGLFYAWRKGVLRWV